jgi:hypothetical protein
VTVLAWDEQRRVADLLDATLDHSGRLVALSETEIGLLIERRQSLITSAVTNGVGSDAGDGLNDVKAEHAS